MATRVIPNIYKWMHKRGDTAVISSAVDGSSTPVAFVYAPTVDVKVRRLMVMIQSNANISAEKYGDRAVLANGVTLELYNGTDLMLDLLDGAAIQSNAHWGALCYDVNPWDPAVGDKFVLVRWTFEKGGEPLYMFPGDELRATINDDLSGQVRQTMNIQAVRA